LCVCNIVFSSLKTGVFHREGTDRGKEEEEVLGTSFALEAEKEEPMGKSKPFRHTWLVTHSSHWRRVLFSSNAYLVTRYGSVS
jgi:hypothetical protein